MHACISFVFNRCRLITLALLLMTAGLPALSGCSAFNAVSQSLFLMTPEQELEFGKQVATEIEKDVTFVNDPEVNQYVKGLCQRVWAKSPRSDIPANFYVIEDPAINAFAIPGGNIYIQTGLINAADDEAELSAVIAHEIGHVVHRHGAQSVSRQTSAGMIQQILIGEGSAQSAEMVAGLVSQGVMFKYSRMDELEADAAAVGTLHRCGYDPLAMSTFFEKLTERYGENNSRLALFFSTHPPNSERISRVHEMSDELAAREKVDYDRPITDLRKVQARLDQLGMAEVQ